VKTLDLFVFIDALGWKLSQDREFLADILPYRQPCATQFGYSSACDPTILTGCLPQEHGHFSCFVKAEGPSPFANLRKWSWLPHAVAGHHRVRNRVSKYTARKLGYTGYFQLYSVPFKKLSYLDYTEKKDIYEPGGINNGQATIFDSWRSSGKTWMRSDWRHSDDHNFSEVEAALEKGEVELAYLFNAGLDAVMHRYGTEGAEVDAAFEATAQRIRGIYELGLKKYKRVHLHIFSDHGMANTLESSDMMLRIDEHGLVYGRDYIGVWDSTMSRFWVLNEKVRPILTEWLKQQPEGELLSDEQLENWGCAFAGNRYGELFYLLQPGTIYAPSFMNMGWVTGMHGYHPEHEASVATWLTNNPHAKPDHLKDIFQVMLSASQGGS